MSTPDNESQKPETWTELSHLVTWASEFAAALAKNRSALASLELARGGNDFPISLANFHVDEAIAVVNNALTFELGLDLHHSETRDGNHSTCCIPIDESTAIHDIVTRIFTCLFAKCPVRLLVKSSRSHSSILAAYIVELMRGCGAKEAEVSCLEVDRRDGTPVGKTLRAIPSAKDSKLSVVATVFKQTDTFAVAQGIIESYFREKYPNLIVLVEEAVYERFVIDWQRYYSHAVHIGSRLDERTTVVDTFNSKLAIELSAIDIKQSHKMTGYAINVLKFRTTSELISLLSHLRKIPFMTVWNDDVLLSREFCLRVNQCHEFWINHIPKSVAGRKFSEELVNFYNDNYSSETTSVYNSLYSQYADEAEQVRKTLASFQKKEARLRTALILQAFIAIVTKSKSLRGSSTVGESVARLKRFQLGSLQRASSFEAGESRIELVSKPVGLALLLVKEENALKSKALLIELIFKNLLIGNGVLLVCPNNTFGAKFTFENDHVIPFKMLHGPVPDISRLSLEESVEQPAEASASMNKKQCPKNTYAVEVTQDMNSEMCEAITVALGSRRKLIWYPDCDVTNYWSSEA